jgi:hypothetical protein
MNLATKDVRLEKLVKARINYLKYATGKIIEDVA